MQHESSNVTHGLKVALHASEICGSERSRIRNSMYVESGPEEKTRPRRMWAVLGDFDNGQTDPCLVFTFVWTSTHVQVCRSQQGAMEVATSERVITVLPTPEILVNGTLSQPKTNSKSLKLLTVCKSFEPSNLYRVWL